MTALTAARDTPRRSAITGLVRTVATGTTLHQGALAAQTTVGLAVPAGHADAATVLGRAVRTATTGESVPIERGVFRFANATGADAITIADYGAPAYALDDQTVTRTNTGHLAAGLVRDVDDAGVWIEI